MPASAAHSTSATAALDVVQHDLDDAQASSGSCGAEVGQPPVVGPQSGPAELEVALGGAGNLHLKRRLGIEGRNGVGEDHLGDDPVRLQLGQSAIVVPVAAGLFAHQVVERHPVLPGPFVELGMEPCLGR